MAKTPTFTTSPDLRHHLSLSLCVLFNNSTGCRIAEDKTILDAENTNNKSSPQPLSDAKEYADDIVQTIPNALLVLDMSLHVQFANDAFYTTFQVQPHATEGQLIYELGNGQWDIPELRLLFEDILPENKAFTGYQRDSRGAP